MVLMKIWSGAACWAAFGKIMRKTLLERKLPDFDALGQGLEPAEASGNMVDRFAD